MIIMIIMIMMVIISITIIVLARYMLLRDVMLFLSLSL